MKKSLFTLLLLAIIGKISFAQITAGSVPAGSFSSNPYLLISDNTIGSPVVGYLDLDCDMNNDVSIYVVKGNTAIDGPNSCYMYITNPDLKIISDTTASSWGVPKLFNLSDPLITSGIYGWSNDTSFSLGCCGSMGCMATCVQTNKYLAFRFVSTNDYYWVKISFDLYDPAPVEFSSYEMIRYCVGNSISEGKHSTYLHTWPNPFDERINLDCSEDIAEISIKDISGKTIFSKIGNSSFIDISLSPGAYIIEVVSQNNNRFSKRLVKL